MEEFGIGRFECFMIQVSASQDFGLEPLIYETDTTPDTTPDNTDDTTPDNSVIGRNQHFLTLEPVSGVISGVYRGNWHPLSAQLDIPKQ